MTIKFSKVAALALAASTLAPAAVQAQVSGIATANTPVAIARAKALGTAYGQINTQYKSYLDQITQKQTEVEGLQQQLYTQFDANGDKQIDSAELAKIDASNNPLKDQIRSKGKEIQDLRDPIIKAQMYVVGEIAKRYGEAQTAVVQAKNINMILAPDAFLWAQPTVDITPAITTELDRVVPTVSYTPPADWQPSRDVAAVHQQIQQLLGLAARAQAARAAQQQQAQPAAQPTGR